MRIGKGVILRPLAAFAALALGTTLTSCSSPLGDSAVASPTGPQSTESVAASISLPVKDAIRFRTEFGLRGDLAYVAQVARDPAATSDFGVPLLPAEVADLLRRQVSGTEVCPTARCLRPTTPR
jgi:hypothetical protein